MNNGTFRHRCNLTKATLLAFSFLSGVIVRADETNTLTLAERFGDSFTLTNTAALPAVVDQSGLFYPQLLLWESPLFDPNSIWWGDLRRSGQMYPCTFLRGFDLSDSNAIWWADFDQLPAALGAVREYPGQEVCRVQAWPLQLTQSADTGEIVVKYPWFNMELLRLAAPEYYQPFQQYNAALRSWCISLGMNPVTYEELVQQGYTFLESPRLVLDVWIASAADRATYESNLAAEQAATVSAAPVRAAAAMNAFGDSGEMMSMDSQQPCTDTNMTLAITSITANSNRWIAITWFPTCTNFIYGVFCTDDLSGSIWTNRAALWGNPNDTTTGWTDATTANVDHRFYKVLGMLPSETSDWDGDGMPDGWEMQYGLNPFDPGDAHACIVCDGTDNLTKYLLGRDPTKAAVSDTSGLVNLDVFTPLE